jgi:OOP family OmpA-OmpF porin
MNPIDDTSGSGSLLEMIKSAVTPDLVERLSGTFGESHAKVNIGLIAASPAVLAALVNRGSTESGAGEILSVIRQFGIDRGFGRSDIEHIVRDTTAGGPSQIRQSLLDRLLGAQAAGLTGLISRISGLSSSSVSSLLGMVAPIALGAIGGQVSGQNLDARGLMTYLGSQKKAIMGALPSELSAMFGAAPATSWSAPASRVRKGWGPWASAIAVAAVILGIVYFLNRSREDRVADAASREAAALSVQAEREARDASPSVSDFFEKTATTDASAPRTMVFEGVVFATDEATLEPGSMDALEDMADAMRSNEAIRISIEGHTDDTGDIEHNKELSLRRAASVRRALMARGIQQERIEVVGWGDEKPVASNADEAGRARNRRIEIVVLDTGVAH